MEKETRTSYSMPLTDEAMNCINYEYIMRNAQLKVINGEMNKNYLMNKPFFPVKGFDDLAAISIVKVNDVLPSNQVGHFAVTDSLLEAVHIKKTELFDASLFNSIKNNPITFRSMRDTLLQTMYPDGVPEDDPMVDMMMPPESEDTMYVLSNKEMFFGASVIMYPGVMEYIHEKLGEDFYIIPSSIHEKLVLRASGVAEAGSILDIINEVNTNVVDSRDFLSNNLYHYSGAEKMVTTIKASDMARNFEAEM